MIKDYWSADGYIHTAVKQGKKQKVNRRKIKEKNKVKDICLNCEETNCSGHCKIFRW